MFDGDVNLEADELHTALVRLLRRRGAHFSDRDLLVKAVETRDGHALHVVIALNGSHQLLGSLVRPIAGRRGITVGVPGVFLLRPDDIRQLFNSIRA